MIVSDNLSRGYDSQFSLSLRSYRAIHNLAALRLCLRLVSSFISEAALVVGAFTSAPLFLHSLRSYRAIHNIAALRLCLRPVSSCIFDAAVCG